MREGESFLHQQDSELHTTEPVEHEQERKKIKGEDVSQKPAEKIDDWLKIIEKTHTSHRENPEVAEKIKGYYHREYVIKPGDVPESAFLLEQRIAREMGHGDIEITQEFKDRKTEQIVNDQKLSLDKWIDYFTSTDADVYPTWAKYWAFQSMVKMGKLEKKEDEKGNEVARFQKRTDDTVSAFPPLNPRAFAMTIGAMKLMIEEKAKEKGKPKKERRPVKIENQSKKLDEKKFQELLSTENFSKIYTQFLIEMPEYSKEGLQEIRGKWIKYLQGSDPKPLVKSLAGHPLEWCTANEDTAKTQLEGGDFHVYYSYGKDDEPENPTIPRLAIRMQGSRIAEPPRGIAAGQNLDPYIVPVLEEKLKDFGEEGEAFKKRLADMKMLTEIEKKFIEFPKPSFLELIRKKDRLTYKQEHYQEEHPGEIDQCVLEELKATEAELNLRREKNQQVKLTSSELSFLYELDREIDGFGQQKDTRIFELVSQRDPNQDMLVIFECEPNQVAHSASQINENTKAYLGTLEPGIFKLFKEYKIDQVYTEFPKKKIDILNLSIGGEKNKDALIEEIEGKGFRVDKEARSMIDGDRFNTGGFGEDRSVLSVRLAVGDMGFKERVSYDQIFKRANELGLALCPPAVGPEYLMQYGHKCQSLTPIAMEPLSYISDDRRERGEQKQGVLVVYFYNKYTPVSLVVWEAKGGAGGTDIEFVFISK